MISIQLLHLTNPEFSLLGLHPPPSGPDRSVRAFADENEEMDDLKKALMSVSGSELIAVGKQIVGDNNYSDEDLDLKFAEFRRQYPAYDAICRQIQNNGKPLMEETLIHASGMEMVVRALIVIAESRDCKPGAAPRAEGKRGFLRE